MSTPKGRDQPLSQQSHQPLLLPEGKGTSLSQSVVAPIEVSELAAIEAPVTTGGGISAPMLGAGAFLFAPVSEGLWNLRNLRNLWHLLRHNPKMLIGLAGVVFFIVVAIVGPLLFHNPNALS